MSCEIIHGGQPGQGGEFTMCGVAFDAFDSGGVEEEIIFAEPGDLITCPACREVIAFYRTVRRNRQPNESVK